MSYVVWLKDVNLSDIALVGGKNASLGELVRAADLRGIRMPQGFALTGAAFHELLNSAGLSERIYAALDALDVADVTALAEVGAKIRAAIQGAELPLSVQKELVEAYRALSALYQEVETDVAVRSSATAEDLPSASFAGQQESYLNVRGVAALTLAVRDCMASLFTDRAIVYRAERGIDHRSVSLSVGVQKMVRSDLAAAGVVFTLDTESGFRNVLIVTSAWGLGESVVKGRVNPDEFWIHKSTLLQGFPAIIRRDIREKPRRLVYASGGSTEEQDVPEGSRNAPSLTDEDVLCLGRWALAIERHYGTPMDIEWAKDGPTGDLFIVQARPETVHSQRGPARLELFSLLDRGELRLSGKSVGSRIASGRVRVIKTREEMSAFQDGEVLVAPMTDPDWEPVLRRAAAVVTDQGGRTCHAAIVSREMGLPCVVGALNATQTLRTGEEVTVSCAEGDEGRIYSGRLAFRRELLDPYSLPIPRVPVMLNVANPQTAFWQAQLPSSGVGLLRMEFVISSWIGIHPMALLHPDRVSNVQEAEEIRRRVGSQQDLSAYFVERLALGIAQIAAAFHPRDVIVRFSDFKTNEYANLLGGQAFEPREDNPMIGFRGASRYYHENYKEGFALECRAIHRVRDEMGLKNLKVMVPFCRTLNEAHRVYAELSANGLFRGEDDLQVYMMCEVPSNVVLADDFAKLFDGFSIGSNDLTQLTLGIDRDSATLSALFNEQDPAVTSSIRHVIESAHRHGCKVGICGQAPSDDPCFARALAAMGIDSISVTSDALPAVTRELAYAADTPARAADAAE